MLDTISAKRDEIYAAPALVRHGSKALLNMGAIGFKVEEDGLKLEDGILHPPLYMTPLIGEIQP